MLTTIIGIGLLVLAGLSMFLFTKAFLSPELDENGQVVSGPGLQPVEFPEQTMVYAKDQPEYKPLPALKFDNDPEGQAITCWQLSWRDRIKILIEGQLWCSVYTFHQPLQPLFFTVFKSDVIRQAASNPAE